MKVADPAILLHEETQGRDASNAALLRSRTEGCLVSVIGLGVSCSKKWPRERMVVQDAAVQMHAIRDAYLNVATVTAACWMGIWKKQQSHQSMCCETTK